MARELNNTALLNDANLQGYWRLESDGTDSSSNSYDLTDTGSPTHVSGKFGNCVDVENSGGEDQYLTIADASCANLEIAGSQTWSAWINPETIDANANVCGKRDGAGANFKRLFVGSSNVVSFTLVGLTTNTSATSTATVSAGSWFHICGVYDSSSTKIKIFVNGVKAEETASGSANDTNGTFSIGRTGSQDATYFDGKIDDVAIFDRALSDAEVEALYKSKPKGAILI